MIGCHIFLILSVWVAGHLQNTHESSDLPNRLFCRGFAEDFAIHSDEGLTPETSVYESFTVANLPY